MTESKAICLRLLGSLALAALMALPAVPAFAQNAGGQGQGTQGAQGQQGQQGQQAQQKGQKKQEATIPAAVLSGLLTGTPEAMLAVKQYLAAVSTSPDEVAKRALQVVEKLKNSGLAKDASLLVAAAERVTQSVKDTLDSAKIVQLKVDRNFKPPAGTIALDFTSADAKVRPGFTRVLSTDGILKGKGMQAIRRPGEDSDMLGDGIAGIQNISLDVPDGEYRVTLMTKSTGDATTSVAPFGQSIVANGKDFSVLQATPENWLKQAVLSNQGTNGFQSATNNDGGATTITVKVIGGKLNLDFNTGAGGAALQTYLTGMIVQPVSQQSVFTPRADVASLLAPSNNQGRFESQVASSIASLLENTSPSAGQDKQQ